MSWLGTSAPSCWNASPNRRMKRLIVAMATPATYFRPRADETAGNWGQVPIFGAGFASTENRDLTPISVRGDRGALGRCAVALDLDLLFHLEAEAGIVGIVVAR